MAAMRFNLYLYEATSAGKSTDKRPLALPLPLPPLSPLAFLSPPALALALVPLLAPPLPLAAALASAAVASSSSTVGSGGSRMALEPPLEASGKSGYAPVSGSRL